MKIGDSFQTTCISMMKQHLPLEMALLIIPAADNGPF